MKAYRSIAPMPGDLARRMNLPGGYQVEARPVPVRRPNRLAAGMQFTERRRDNIKSRTFRDLCDMEPKSVSNVDALALIVNGTTDKFRSLRAWHVEAGRCPCCNAKSRGLVLTDKGRLRLKAARRRAAERQAATQ